jgi:D-alanyl-D-alanine dipeptidase
MPELRRQRARRGGFILLRQLALFRRPFHLASIVSLLSGQRCWPRRPREIAAMLVDIEKLGIDVCFDIAYATNRNFTGKPVYARPGCYLHPDAAAALERAAHLVRPLGCRLKIFDAFRPSEAQWVLWNFRPDPEFLADPRRGSPHSRGVAVDLTLIRADGNELDMGTGFDEFTARSHHGDTEISAAGFANRLLLMGLMTTAGWDFYRNEWWHYQLFDSKNYPVLSDRELALSMMA